MALFLTDSEIWTLIAWNFSLKIAAKPLQMETWLLLTANRKSPAPYPMVSLPIFYGLPFSHNTARLAYHTVQGHPRRFTCHLKVSMHLPISNQ